jgi:hypothetical protein
MAKNIADFFGEKQQDKAKCKNILDFDFVNEKASNISPEKLSYDVKNQQRQNSSSNKKSDYIRKYDESFIKYGFSFITQNGIEKPMCVVCGETLANSSMAPSKMQLHLETQHQEHKSKEEGFFRAKLNNMNSQKILLSESCGFDAN